MSLLNGVLVKLLEKKEVQVTFPNISTNLSKAIESECYRFLLRIRDVVDDDSLDDPDCFDKIEEIIRLFEEYDALCGPRHDF